MVAVARLWRTCWWARDWWKMCCWWAATCKAAPPFGGVLVDWAGKAAELAPRVVVITLPLAVPAKLAALKVAILAAMEGSCSGKECNTTANNTISHKTHLQSIRCTPQFASKNYTGRWGSGPRGRQQTDRTRHRINTGWNVNGFFVAFHCPAKALLDSRLQSAKRKPN